MKLFQAPLPFYSPFLYLASEICKLFSFKGLFYWLLILTTHNRDLKDLCPKFWLSELSLSCAYYCKVFNLQCFVSSLDFWLMQVQFQSELPYPFVCYATCSSYSSFGKNSKYFKQHFISQQQTFNKYIVRAYCIQNIFNSYSNFLVSSFCSLMTDPSDLSPIILSPPYSPDKSEW